MYSIGIFCDTRGVTVHVFLFRFSNPVSTILWHFPQDFPASIQCLATFYILTLLYILFFPLFLPPCDGLPHQIPIMRITTNILNVSLCAVTRCRSLYWTDWNREAPKIETSTVGGEGRRVVVSDGIGLPNALTYDSSSRQICWADAGKRHACESSL